MKLAFAILASLFVTTVAFAQTPGDLKFKNGALQAHYFWKQGPQSMAESILDLNWQNGSNQSAVELPGTFNITLVMTDMGMMSPPTQITHLVDGAGNPLPGAYEVSNIQFTMGGKWDVQVAVTYNDGSTETQTFSVDLPGM